MYYRFLCYSLWALTTIALFTTACRKEKQQEKSEELNNSEEQEKGIRKDSSKLFNTNYALNNYWRDNRAETARYKAEKVVYGEKRNYTCKMMLVKDSLNSKAFTKEEDSAGSEIFETMRFSRLARIQTGKSPLNFSTHMYFKQEYPEQLLRMTFSSQDWNGNVFKVFQKQTSGYVYNYFSYWMNQGTGDTLLSEKLWFEDQLPYTLRTIKFRDGLVFNKPVTGTQISNRANIPELYNARFTVRDYNKEEEGSVIPLWKVIVSLTPDRQNIYYFSKAYPHTLTRMTAWDGRTLQLMSAKHTKLQH